MMFATLTAAFGLFGVAFGGKVSPSHGFKSKYEGASLVFTEDWSKGIDFSLWKHEITMGGGGNWEFEYYINNRSNSFVENGTLMIKPTLTADKIGAQQVSGAVSLNHFSSSLPSLQLSHFLFLLNRSQPLLSFGALNQVMFVPEMPFMDALVPVAEPMS